MTHDNKILEILEDKELTTKEISVKLGVGLPLILSCLKRLEKDEIVGRRRLTKEEIIAKGWLIRGKPHLLWKKFEEDDD